MQKNIVTNFVTLIASISMGFIFSSGLFATDAPEEYAHDHNQEQVIASKTEEELNLQKGRIFIAGHLSFIYEMTERSTPPQHKFSIISDVGLGYFFWDRIAIGASLPIKLTLVPAQKGLFGVSFFSTYFFKFNNLISPYVGIDITPGYSVNEQAFKLGAGINAGVLICLSPNLALDFGLAPEIYFPLSKQQKWKLEVPVGFVGLRAFF